MASEREHVDDSLAFAGTPPWLTRSSSICPDIAYASSTAPVLVVFDVEGTGIATTCQREELAAYDRRMDILTLTDVVACGETVKHGKPDTSLFQQCLEALKIMDPAHAVAVGDTAL
jgi:Haloacid dehalogenase-like hydrolase